MALAGGDEVPEIDDREAVLKQADNKRSSIHGEVDSGSGSENGEKPVREKLKQTELDETGRGVEDSQEVDHSDVRAHGAQVKATRKRSLEGKDASDEQSTPSGIHVRKRSRDTRSKESKKRGPTRKPAENIPEHQGEQAEQSENESDKSVHSDGIATPVSSDEEASQTTGTLRRLEKKRSRDDLDLYGESDRDRKIATTAQSRVRRSSSEGPSDNSDCEYFANELRGQEFEQTKKENGVVSGMEGIKHPHSNNKNDDLPKPGRKRSRDSLDEEYERDQKKSSSARQSRIKTTSSESLRGTKDGNNAEGEKIGASISYQIPGEDVVAKRAQSQSALEVEAKIFSAEIMSQRTFSDANSDSFGTSSSPSKSFKPLSGGLSDDLPQTSASAFAASGFAGMTGATSPFGALGSKASATQSPFASLNSGLAPVSTTLHSNLSSSPKSSQTAPSAIKSHGFSSIMDTQSSFESVGTQPGKVTSPFSSIGKGPAQPTSSFASIPATNSKQTSPFASGSSQPGSSTLGNDGQTFGSGFGSGFGGESKLSSFAAPVGDTNLGASEPAKPFGAPADGKNTGDEESGDDEEDNVADQDDSGENAADDPNGSNYQDNNPTHGDQSRKYRIKDGMLVLLLIVLPKSFASSIAMD